MVDLSNVAMEGLDGDIERDFVADSNEATHFKLVRSLKDVESEDRSFKPEMSHQVFGKTEKIFGYKDLKINLYYTTGWLRTYINISYTEKISPSVIGLPADDVLFVLSSFLDHDYFENLDLFLNAVKEEPSFKPSGNLVHCFTVKEDNSASNFEIYHSHLSNTGSSFFKNYYNRLQRFLIWYIDGASYVDIDDDRWHYFLIYEKYINENNEKCYGIAGLATVYEFYAYPDSKRPRISQFLILPPFQKRGLGVHLLQSVYNYYSSVENVIDIQVEDPTKNCQAIRDYVDLCRCEKLSILNEERLKVGFSRELEEELRKKLKIPKKQARRLYEIMLLKTVNKADDEEYKKYRLLVKNRLNAPFTKMTKIMRFMEKNLKPTEVDEANVFQKTENRLKILKKKYKKLEKQYERVITRVENAPQSL